MTNDNELTEGQARLRAIVRAHPGGKRPESELRALRELIAADPMILADRRTGQRLSPADANATYARFQAMRWAPRAEPVDRLVLDVDHYVYARAFSHRVRGEPAALGGVKGTSTMQFLLNFAAGVQSPTEHVHPSVLTGSRICCEPGANHRTLAAFLWQGELVAEGPRITVIADEPDEPLRQACAIVDRYAEDIDGFRPPDDHDADAHRSYLHELAERLTATPLPQRYHDLDDLERALAEQTRPAAIAHPTRSPWWHRRGGPPASASDG